MIEQDWDAEGTAYWDRAGRLPNIVVGAEESEPVTPEVDPDEPVVPVPVEVRGSVNLRTGPGKNYERLCVVRGGAYGLAYPAEDGWSHIVVPKGDSFVEGYMNAKYLEELV